MPTFSSLQNFIDTITAKLVKPRRSRTADGVRASDILSAITDMGTYVSENVGDVLEFEETVDAKADKTYVDAQLATKADASALTPKADKTYVDAQLATKADASALAAKADTSSVTPKADKTYVDAQLATKADASALAAKADTSSVTPKADKTYVDAQLATKADASALTPKADKTYVDTQLATKADASALSAKVDKNAPVFTGVSFFESRLHINNGSNYTDQMKALYVVGDSEYTGDVKVNGKLQMPTGSNKSVGQFTLVAGVATVTTSACTTNSLIFLQLVTPNGTVSAQMKVTAANGSFTANAITNGGGASTANTSTYNYLIIN